MQNPNNPLRDAVKEDKGCRLARGKSWMGQAEQSIQHVCDLTELKQVKGFTVKQGGRTIHEDSGAQRVKTSSLTMEVEAVTHAIQWLAFQHDALSTHAIILIDSINLLQKLESGMGCPDSHAPSSAPKTSVDLLRWA